MKTLLTVLLLSALSFGQTSTTEDAEALEAQYKTCAKHYIPADKCTPEIYRQLKAKDNTPLDPTAAAALKAVKEYQARLKNPASMQVQIAYVTDDGAVCLEIGGQNGAGGMSVSRVVLTSKGQWFDETGFGGSASADFQRHFNGGYQVDRWQVRVRDSSGHRDGVCQKRREEMQPGKDVTEKVNNALKAEKQ
jgi:hypothetical protein